MRTLFALALVAAITVTLSPAPAVAHEDNSDPATYLLRVFVPNRGIAPNGDRLSVTCAGRQSNCGTFRIHPKALPNPPQGEFSHTFAAGGPPATGTWRATDLISFDSYGCGVVLGNPIPPNVCGGALKLRVLLTPTGTNLKVPGIMTFWCIVGPNPPNDADEPSEEGVTLVVPGTINFTQANGGGNNYVRQP